GTEAGDLVGAGRRGFHIQRGRNDVLVDRTVRQPDAATTRAARGRYGVRVGDTVLGEGSERLRLALRTRSHGPRVAGRPDAFQVDGVVAWRAGVSRSLGRETAIRGRMKPGPEEDVTVE